MSRHFIWIICKPELLKLYPQPSKTYEFQKFCITDDGFQKILETSTIFVFCAFTTFEMFDQLF